MVKKEMGLLKIINNKRIIRRLNIQYKAMEGKEESLDMRREKRADKTLSCMLQLRHCLSFVPVTSGT